MRRIASDWSGDTRAQCSITEAVKRGLQPKNAASCERVRPALRTAVAAVPRAS